MQPPLQVGARNRWHLSFWRLIPSFVALFGPIWWQSMSRGQLWCCDVFPCFKGISGGFGSWAPNSPFVLLGPEYGFLEQRKKRQKDKWYPSHACTAPPPRKIGKITPKRRTVPNSNFRQFFLCFGYGRGALGGRNLCVSYFLRRSGGRLKRP